MQGKGLLNQLLKLHQQLTPLLKFEPLNDREFLDSALRLTDPGIHQTDKHLIEVYTFWNVERLMRLPRNALDNLAKTFSTENFKKEMRKWWDEIFPDRERFRSNLKLFIDDRQGSRKQLQGIVDEAMTRVVVLPYFVWSETSWHLNYRAIPITFDGTAGYALALLLDSKKRFGEALRECKMCTKIFLSDAPARGGPRPVYCEPKCRVAQARISGYERLERFRLRQRQSKKRGKK